MRSKTCCFTGHRVISEVETKRLKTHLKTVLEELIDTDYRYFGTGGALGFDTIAALTVLELKQKYPHIRLILVLPCVNQTKGWKDEDVRIYEYIKSLCDKYVYTSREYTKGCMHKRNRHLVDNSSCCICYLKKDSSGTAYTVGYALKQGLKVINIAENSEEMK